MFTHLSLRVSKLPLDIQYLIQRTVFILLSFFFKYNTERVCEEYFLIELSKTQYTSITSTQINTCRIPTTPHLNHTQRKPTILVPDSTEHFCLFCTFIYEDNTVCSAEKFYIEILSPIILTIIFLYKAMTLSSSNGRYPHIRTYKSMPMLQTSA